MALEEKSQLHCFTFTLSIPGITGLKRHQNKKTQKAGRVTHTPYHMDSNSPDRESPQAPSGKERVHRGISSPTPANTSGLHAGVRSCRPPDLTPQGPAGSAGALDSRLEELARVAACARGQVPARAAPRWRETSTLSPRSGGAESVSHGCRESATTLFPGSKLAQDRT